ncbi:hypothetical protein PC9H_010556 [Pleurotus ostreatus]|uniref:Uncharacterized protein n=2 Tax=Pleurotus TaxID=5320 RepID=A0A8H7DPU7_PLEOS|nr:uncharacterized protein PC9H_010556 [Pleurotus ostreatus]KAF7422400.1 hypothetical protein PC9H_010556 [Pleurotus ostreatus]KAG9227715.1 hypothetical protein CCMSSC00406_0000639 [Pleurotus cornucopiae]KAJ8691767.1 hypothetical protein PTI98_011302 [Pleurotus ostreatus]
MNFIKAIVFYCLAVVGVLAATPLIIKPSNGTSIAPGHRFNFSYQSIAERGCSSYHVHVWLFFHPPTPLFVTTDYATGHYFGRFQIQNWPGVPYTEHPLPSYFTMPDFSINPRGWGAGLRASNIQAYLAVMEEYATGNGTLGNRFSLTYNTVRYNATKHHSNKELPELV